MKSTTVKAHYIVFAQLAFAHSMAVVNQLGPDKINAILATLAVIWGDMDKKTKNALLSLFPVGFLDEIERISRDIKAKMESDTN